MVQANPVMGCPKSKVTHDEQRDSSGCETRTAVLECRDEEQSSRTILGSVITYSSRYSDSASNENDLQVTKLLPSDEEESARNCKYYPGYYDDEHESHTSDELMNADSNFLGMRTCRERSAARKPYLAKLSGRDTTTEPAVARKKRKPFYSTVGKAFTGSTTNHMQRENENRSCHLIQADLRSRISNSRNSAESSSYGSKKPFCSVVGKVDRYPMLEVKISERL